MKSLFFTQTIKPQHSNVCALKIQAQFNDLIFYIYIYILFLQIHGFQHFEKRSLSSVNQIS